MRPKAIRQFYGPNLGRLAFNYGRVRHRKSLEERKLLSKSPLWMLLAPVDHPGLHAAVPALAWLAADRGMALECYLEGPRSSGPFAETGSTILGGFHYQQFNYLNPKFDVRYLLLGNVLLFIFIRNLRCGDVPVLAAKLVGLPAGAALRYLLSVSRDATHIHTRLPAEPAYRSDEGCPASVYFRHGC